MSIEEFKATAESIVSIVACLEWINAHRWNFNYGSAGTTHILSRAILDASAIDNGSYKSGVDPNLHALFTPLEAFVNEFPSYFQRPLSLKLQESSCS